MKIKSFLVLAIIAISGCTHRYNYYDFESAVIPMIGGRLEISISGTYKGVRKIPEITEKSNPYKLRVDFKTTDAPNQEIQITIDRLTFSSGESIEFNDTETDKTSDWRPHQEISSAVNVAGPIELKYVPITVEGSIKYKGETQQFKAEMNTKKWSEYRSNWFDGMMSI